MDLRKEQNGYPSPRQMLAIDACVPDNTDQLEIIIKLLRSSRNTQFTTEHLISNNIGP
jgi:hypothetical protein